MFSFLAFILFCCGFCLFVFSMKKLIFEVPSSLYFLSLLQLPGFSVSQQEAMDTGPADKALMHKPYPCKCQEGVVTTGKSGAQCSGGSDGALRELASYASLHVELWFKGGTLPHVMWGATRKPLNIYLWLSYTCTHMCTCLHHTHASTQMLTPPHTHTYAYPKKGIIHNAKK